MLNTAQPLDPKLCVLTARKILLKKKLLGKATQTELQREKKDDREHKFIYLLLHI